MPMAGRPTFSRREAGHGVESMKRGAPCGSSSTALA
jgi:hypothetical protein